MSILEQTKRVSENRVRTHKRLLRGSMIGFVVGLIGCGLLLDIDQTVKVQGTVVSENHRKSVHSPEAAIVKAVYVREGDHVKKHDVLLRLKSDQEEAELKKRQIQLADLYLLRDRLNSELAQKNNIVFSAKTITFDQQHLQGQGQPKEQNLFNQRKTAWQAFHQAYVRRISQLKTSIVSLSEQSKSKQQQLALITEEVAGLKQLFEKGLVAKSRYFAVKRKQSELQEQMMLAKSRMHEQKDQVQQITAQQRQKLSEREADLQERLQKANQDIRITAEQMKILDQQIAQKVIRAPADGVTFNMRALHAGYVTKSVETLMYIVPEEETLVIDSRLPDREITKITLDMETRIYPLSSNSLFDQPVEGKVQRISSDALSSEEQTDNQYLVRVAPNSKNNFIPGMTVDMYFLSGKVSLLNYIIRPLLERLDV